MQSSKTGFLICTAFFAMVIIGAGVAAADEDPLGERHDHGQSQVVSSRDGIELIPFDSLECPAIITFDDVAGGAAPGTNYDAVFESNGAAFAERFVGQTLSYDGDFDILTGTPSSPLSLQIGAPNQNLLIYLYGTTNSQILCGNGPLGWPDYSAIGEGSFAVLFDYDQREFGFQLVGGNDGPATVNFFRRDGSLVDSIEITNLSQNSYGFRRLDGLADIAGVSVHNIDPAGIGVDNLCHSTEGVPGYPPICDAGGPYVGDAGVPVQFDGTGSFDTDGTIVSYEWDFGDGSTGTGPTPVHTYAEDGEYVVTLCVTDNEELRSCCSSEPVVSAEAHNWSSVKELYR
jgi:hypothetical protein